MRTLLSFLVLGFLVGCNSTPVNNEPQPTPTPTSTPVPTPTPVAQKPICPCLVAWDLGIQAYYHANGKPSSSQDFGGSLRYDTTPKFSRYPGDRFGAPCNAEHDNCGGRQCEDPRGPQFVVSGPSGVVQTRNPENNYQLILSNLQPGNYTVVAKPRSDLKDAQGVPVEVCPGMDAARADTWSL